jgi:uncharacterized protein (TIGR01777 family)
MRVLLTGGSGLIGRAVAADLAARGHEAVVLSRDPSRVRGLPSGVRVARWDGKSGAAWSSRIDGGSAIVHLAGEGIAGGRWTAERKRRIRASRVDSGAAVLDAIRAAREPPFALLQASAVGYYGDAGDEVVTEERGPGEGFLAETCVAWESSTAPLDAICGKGVRRVLLRTGIVLSRDGGALPRMALPFRLRVGGPLGSGRQWLPWIHIADQVAAIRFLLEQSEARGPFNLTAPNPVTNRDFSRALVRALHRPSLMIPVPAFVLRAVLGELSAALLEGQRALPTRLQALGFAFQYSQVEPALQDLLR